jgi:dolichol kinase
MKAAVGQGLSLILLIAVFQVVVTKVSLGKEAKRRWQHALTGHALVQVSYLLPLDVCICLLLLSAFGMAYIRCFQSDLYTRTFSELLRPEEMKAGCLPGAFYFLIGTALTAYLFPLQIAQYAVECLSIADPLASWVGRSIRSPKIHASASVAGCAACFIAASAIGGVYLGGFASPWKIAFGSLACCLAEAFSFGYDNLLIPITTAAAVNLML